MAFFRCIGGSGGSGGVVTEVYTPIVNTNVVSGYNGMIIRNGSFASFFGRINYRTGFSTYQKIFTIPDACKPATYSTFEVGMGGNTTVGYGYINQDGEVYVNPSNSSKTYDYINATWIVADSSIVLTTDTNVSNVDGKISISGDFAYLAVKLRYSSSSDGWKNGIITLPSAILPTSAVNAFVRSNGSPKYKDASYTNATGKINVWLPRGTIDLEIYMDWKIGG